MSYEEIKGAIDEIGQAFEEFKKVNDDRLKALEDGDESLAGELDQKLAKINESITADSKRKKKLEDELQAHKDRIEELESRRNEPVLTPLKKAENEYNGHFEKWIRSGGQDPESERAMKTIERKAYDLQQEAKLKGETKQNSVITSNNAQGGFAVPEEIVRMIEKLEHEFSPVRRIVRVMQSGTSDFKQLVNIRGATAGWVGEGDTRNQTDISLLRERAPTMGEIYAYAWATDWSLDDVFFNVENWLAEETAAAFALEEGQAVIDGNGTNKPTGLLNTQPVLTDDAASPLRDADAFEYVAHDASASLSPPSGTAQIVDDSLIDMIYTLNSMYRSNARWIMNSNTIGSVRKLKDDQGRYHWQPGLQAGQPSMLLGYPLETWEQMPDVALNAFPIAIGDWNRAYLLTDRIGLRITRDDVTKVGYTKFYIRRREGGIVLNNDAAKFGRTIG